MEEFHKCVDCLLATEGLLLPGHGIIIIIIFLIAAKGHTKLQMRETYIRRHF